MISTINTMRAHIHPPHLDFPPTSHPMPPLWIVTEHWSELCWVSAAVCRLSLVAASGGCSLVSRHALLIAEASLAVEHRF